MDDSSSSSELIAKQTLGVSPGIFILLILAISFYCLDYFFRISPGLVVQALMQQYHTNAIGISSFVSAFYLGYMLFQLPSGFILDRYSLRLVVVFSIVLCTAAFCIFIFAHNYVVGIVLRWLVGATSAFSFISVLFIARVYLPGKYFSLISGIAIAAGTLAASGVQTIGAFLLKYLSWQLALFFLAMWGFIIALLLMLPQLRIAEPLKQKAPISYRATWQQVVTLLRHPKFVLNGLVGGLFYLPTSILAAAWGISLLEQRYLLTTTGASTGIMFLFLGWAVGSPVVGMYADRLRMPQIFMGIFAFFAGVNSLILLYCAQWVGQWVFLVLFLFGLFSSAQVIVWKIFSKICPLSISGIGVSLTNMIIMAIASIAQLFIGWLIQQGSNHENFLIKINLLNGLWVIPVFFLLSALLTLRFKKPQF